MNSISLPSFSKLKSDPVRIRRGLKKAVSLSTFVGAPAFIGLFLISEDVILVLLGQKWIDAAGILRWLCAAAIIRTIVEFNGNILIATGRSRLALIMTCIGTALLIVFGLIGAQYGASGVAMALAFKNFIMFSIWLFVMQNVFDFKIPMHIASFAGSFAVSLIMALVVLAVRYVTVIEMEWALTVALPMQIIAGIAAYIGASMLISPNILKEIAQNIFTKLSDKK